MLESLPVTESSHIRKAEEQSSDIPVTVLTLIEK